LRRGAIRGYAAIAPYDYPVSAATGAFQCVAVEAWLTLYLNGLYKYEINRRVVKYGERTRKQQVKATSHREAEAAKEVSKTSIANAAPF